MVSFFYDYLERRKRRDKTITHEHFALNFR